MAAPTQLTVTYASGSTQVLPIPAGLLYSDAVLNISRGGGFWFTDASGLLTWIPLSQITKITAA
jgi:hypothetical protein